MCVWGGSDLVKQLLNTKGSKRRRKKHKRRIERLELVNITRPKYIFPTMNSQLETHLQKAVLDGQKLQEIICISTFTASRERVYDIEV